MAAPTSWWEWLAGLCNSLRGPPKPGTPEARLEELRVGALLKKEAAKPPGERDEERIHQLELWHTALMLGNVEIDVTRLDFGVRNLQCPTDSTCCAASEWVRQRSAASRQAVLDYYEQCAAQLREQLAAKQARRPVEAAVPALRLDLPEALQQQPPWLDLCRACAKQLEENELAEERCRVHQSHFQEEPQAGAAAPAAKSRRVAGATTAAADLPALEVQQQPQPQPQQQPQQLQPQQQQCGGRDAGSSDGAPITPIGAAALPPQQHGSSDQEQEQWHAAGERSLHRHEAR